MQHVGLLQREGCMPEIGQKIVLQHCEKNRQGLHEEGLLGESVGERKS
jgi:hypothetical protein